ncbi:hypothetical protein [Pyrobaculum aerophilum]|uniref:Uncharacterized protein n=1 Tax=Pyrobaculum aerophilum TaxID=13773 RepID=A0A371QXF4_9CREN|nr:hypothetical protein [Pyrobaculum aerophilum]RFA95028.1 hypothetical protein CGL51_08575 [Pyrobaculum aerophilum]RFA96741.1 hypothetical protein CGL52_10605 [Pyrobaculum aerophilum]
MAKGLPEGGVREAARKAVRAAMVGTLKERGGVVRHNFWVKARPRPTFHGVIKEASKLAGKGKWIPIRVLIIRAVRVFLRELKT